MNTYKNEKTIRRNAKIGQYSSLAGLVVLIGGLVVTFYRSELIGLAYALLILGFLLSQIGMYFMNRWGRRPRPDELISQAVKGLDSKYALYHYMTSASHLLVGPAGIWLLIPKYQQGVITYSKGKYRQRSAGFLQTYMRIFAQEGLGRPEVETSHEIQSLQSYFIKKGLEEFNDEIQAVLVFTNDKAEIQINEDDQAPIPAIPLSKLKEYIRKKAKADPLSTAKFTALQSAINPEPVE